MVSLTTPHGTTRFPSLLFQGDAGNFNTSREELKIAGAHRRSTTWAHSVGCKPAMRCPSTSTTWPRVRPMWAGQPSANTQIRGTLHYGADATGVPNAWDFYHMTDEATQKDQDYLHERVGRQPDVAGLS